MFEQPLVANVTHFAAGICCCKFYLLGAVLRLPSLIKATLCWCKSSYRANYMLQAFSAVLLDTQHKANFVARNAAEQV